jgi:hypothetical protein
MYVGYVGTAAPGCPPDRARHEFRVGPGLRPGQAEQSSAAPSPHATQIRPKQKWRSARLGRRATNFSLYFQNIKSKGANRTFLQLYIPPRIRDLARNTHEKGLDKISSKVPRWPIQAVLWLEWGNPIGRRVANPLACFSFLLRNCGCLPSRSKAWATRLRGTLG